MTFMSKLKIGTIFIIMFKLKNYLHKSKQIIKLEILPSFVPFKPISSSINSTPHLFTIFRSENKTVYENVAS